MGTPLILLQDLVGGGNGARAGRKSSLGGRPSRAVRQPRGESLAHSYASSLGVRSRMQLQKTRDTGPELAVRRALHAMGLRYRVDRPPLPGLRRRADIVFGPVKVAVFVDGCFWHGCLEHGRRPGSNNWYWPAKIQRNKDRDADTDQRLAQVGWAVVRAWEHEQAEEVAARVARLVRIRRADLSRAQG